MLLIEASDSAYDFAQNINLREDVLRIRFAPRRTWFGLGYRTPADSRREQKNVYAKKMLIYGTQVEAKSVSAFHHIKSFYKLSQN